MLKKNSNLKWYIATGITLVLISLCSYYTQVILFKRPQETMFYFFQDLSFVPLQALIVTFVIDRLLQRQKRISLFRRIYVAVGIFFNEAGNDMIRILVSMTDNSDIIKERLAVSSNWKKKDFDMATREISRLKLSIRMDDEILSELVSFLDGHKLFILQLLENSNLIEHDSFTDTLLAVYHMTDELSRRKNFGDLPETDVQHLKFDIGRAYHALIIEWIAYMNHLKNEYPFMFSLAHRSNPFIDRNDVIIYR